MAMKAWHDLSGRSIQQTKRGEMPMASLDDVICRILPANRRAGLSNGVSSKQRALLKGVVDVFGNADYRALARQVVCGSLVLLKSQNNVSVIDPKLRIFLCQP